MRSLSSLERMLLAVGKMRGAFVEIDWMRVLGSDAGLAEEAELGEEGALGTLGGHLGVFW